MNKLYGKGEDSINKSPDAHNNYDNIKDEDFGASGSGGGKWKMMFSKDERTNEQMAQKSKPQPKQQQFGFGYESEEDEQLRNAQGHPIIQAAPTTSAYGNVPSGSSSSYDKNNKKRQLSPPPKPKEVPCLNPVKSGPVVLDKFGNFRLATTEPMPKLPAESRRSRSRSRRRDSRSRSSSRSPRRRRSGSYNRSRKYSRSRSYSRSYSRSRSRSRSRTRYARSFRGGRGSNASYNDRGNYFKPRFVSTTSRGRGRGGNSSGFRDNFRDRDANFRGRGTRVDRPWRGGRRFGRFDRSRSRSFSIERNPKSPNDRAGSVEKKRSRSPAVEEGEGRWTEEKRETREPENLEEMEKLLEKARKEKKEDMVERNKDLVKKTSSGGW